MQIREKKRGLILFVLAALPLTGVGNAEAAEGIRLADSHIRSNYVEVERVKSTKQVIVIDKKSIEGKGYRNLGEVLNHLPGINVGLTGWGDIDIRGQGAGQAQRNIQVMLDGAPITILTSHPMMNDYNYIPVDNIEKIEIIPGGGSVMYGSGAAGGIINITTNLKTMSRPQKSLQTTWSGKEKNLALQWGESWNGKTNLQISHTRSNKDLYFNNTWRNTDYTALGVSHELDARSRLSFRYSYLKEDGQFIASLQKKNFDKYGKDYVPPSVTYTAGLDDSGKPIKRTVAGYLNADRELSMYSINYAKNFSVDRRFSADIFFNDGYFRNNNLGEKQMDHSTRGWKLKYDYRYGQKRDKSLLVGLDYYKQDSKLQYDDYVGGWGGQPMKVHPLHFFYDKTVKALYVSHSLRKGKWEWVQGLRQDYTEWGYDKTAAKSSGKGSRETLNRAVELAASYQYNDVGRAYIRYERGFTSPDGIQMADDFGKIIQGTAAEDEQFDLYEIGIRDKIGISTVQVTAFYSQTDNQLDRWLAFTPQGLIRRTLNLLKTERKGIEISASQKAGKWSFSQGYTYLRGKSDYNDFGRKFIEDNRKIQWTQQSLRQVPKHKFTLRAQYEFSPKWSGGVQYNYVGAYNNFIEDENAEDNQIGSHKLVDVDFTYKKDKDTVLYAGVKNLFNEKYASYMGEKSGGYYSLLPGDERLIYVGAKRSF